MQSFVTSLNAAKLVLIVKMVGQSLRLVAIVDVGVV
jgi:hypothetical protein